MCLAIEKNPLQITEDLAWLDQRSAQDSARAQMGAWSSYTLA
jgi:hypothetical protein